MVGNPLVPVTQKSQFPHLLLLSKLSNFITRNKSIAQHMPHYRVNGEILLLVCNWYRKPQINILLRKSFLSYLNKDQRVQYCNSIQNSNLYIEGGARRLIQRLFPIMYITNVHPRGDNNGSDGYCNVLLDDGH